MTFFLSPGAVVGRRPLRFLTSLLLFCVAEGCIAEAPPQQPEAVVHPLIQLLLDPDPVVRRSATVALGRIARPEAAEPLIGRLSDPEPTVRQSAAWALGSLGETVLGRAGVPLARLVDDPAPSVKRAAANALATLGATQAVVEVMTGALQHGDVETRRAVVLALVGAEAKSAYPALVDALRDKDSRVRQGALAALGELADMRSLGSFRERLLEDSNEGVRSEAAFRLGKLGTPREIEVLRSVAAADDSSVVRRWAQWSTDQLRPPDGSD